jgi:peptide/nickel transport system permease protein
MSSYIMRRILISLVTFFLATLVIFFIIQLPPGDYVDFVMGRLLTANTDDVGVLAETLREYYGLNQPVYQRYLKWVGGVLQGNLGYSFLYRKEVSQIIMSELLWTVVVVGLCYLFAWMVGITIGIYSAVRQYSWADHLFTFIGFLGVSIPNFFLAMALVFLLMQLGSDVNIGLFSQEFVEAPWSLAKLADLLKHIWLPVIAVGTAQMAGIIRFMRGNLLDILGKPYIDTARTKGLKEITVILKHAVRNAINPLISIAGMQFPGLISGIVITAVVLDLPLIGPTFLRALNSQDMFLAGGYLLVIVVFLLIGNILADLMLAVVDPRIRYD